MSKTEYHPDDLLGVLGDFTSTENWEKFFSIRGIDDSFEWYAEWPQLSGPLLFHLNGLLEHMNHKELSNNTQPISLNILVPGCGNSQLSEHIYDSGFQNIINIDFSKVAIKNMLYRNLRQRPNMRWRVMDMTDLQFGEETFDAVVDKGGLDALMEPAHGPGSGNKYLSEVKRVLKTGGVFICLTLADPHVLGTLFPKMRFGWRATLCAVAAPPAGSSVYQTLMLVAHKEKSNTPHQIVFIMPALNISSYHQQESGIREAVDRENGIRARLSCSSDVTRSFGDVLSRGLGEFDEGRRVQFSIDASFQGCCCRAVLMDASAASAPFVHHCAVFLVPQNKAREWPFSSEEGQWTVVKSSRAARLIMVFLDSYKGDSKSHMSRVQNDLSPFIRQLAPRSCVDASQIPFMMESDGIKERSVVHEVVSGVTGPIVVEDVRYENPDEGAIGVVGSDDAVFRRLIFQRNESLVQSEALLFKKTRKMKRKKQEVDHGYLASSYHTGIVAGFILISSHMEELRLSGRMGRAVVIGAGAGLLPMFLHRWMAFMRIDVVELDPIVVRLAKEYFGFRADERLLVHVADGVGFIMDEEDEKSIDVVVVDVDSPEFSGSGMTCPSPPFVELPFLLKVKSAIGLHGLFIINLVSRSSSVKQAVFSLLKQVFVEMLSLPLEKDVNEVIFCLNCEVKGMEKSEGMRWRLLDDLHHSTMAQLISSTAQSIRSFNHSTHLG